ncbi:hypothetical protein [Kutzneria sp. CA-103260]|uniref:hypothetical protein n=1 Tax=Kutzneria sp. CA-103260 TaxID=2802641 RepID=UPI001BAB13FE|nr:hypothetical protein [Kutzneria sp. CA-103260]QUQ66212.1 hypothetical protein JJ691_39380 [Kutzneria sp. CA-103260]
MEERQVWRALLASVLLLVGTLVACADATPGSPTASTPTGVASTTHSDALCESLRQLGSDVHSLRTLDVVAVGANGLNAAVHQVYVQLGDVAQQAGNTLAPQAQALRAGLDDLSDTVSGLTDAASVRAALPQLGSQLAAVSAGWDTLRRQAADICP